MPKIFWVASYPKSGNTWMRAFLANMLLAKDRPLSLNEIGEACASEANIHWYTPLIDAGENSVDALPAERIMELRQRAQQRIAGVNKNDVFIKTHSFNGRYLGYPLIRADHTMGAVYIVRDPRDVVVSAADHWGLTLNEMIDCLGAPESETAPMPGRQVFEKLSSWSWHVKSWTGQKLPWPTLVYRYEDLLADPVKQFGQLAKGIGLSKDPARIRQVVEWTSFKQLQTMESEEGFVERSDFSERFFRAGKAGQWRQHLTSGQVARIEHDHGEQMRRFGYL
jgi:hypothetical protein